MGLRRLIIEVPEGEEDEVKRVLMELTSEVRGESLVVSGRKDTVKSFQLNCTAYRASTICSELKKIGVGKDFGVITIVPALAALPRPDSSGKEGRSYMTRLPAGEIHNLILDQSGGNLDYFLLCFSAAALASVGLGTSSGVMIIASMLVSPLMGPLLSITYGLACADFKMICIGLVSEILGIALTFSVGLVSGILLAPVAPEYHWPTSSMKERGDPRALYTGVIFAIASGIAVGVAVTSNGVNSLVGVAISASLLPPIVNAGMSLSFAYGADFMYDHGLCFSSTLCTSYVHEKTKFRDLAFNSAYLFLINIAFIFVFCILIFKIKGLACCYRSSPKPWWNDLPRDEIKTIWASKEEKKRKNYTKMLDVSSVEEERFPFAKKQHLALG